MRDGSVARGFILGNVPANPVRLGSLCFSTVFTINPDTLPAHGYQRQGFSGPLSMASQLPTLSNEPHSMAATWPSK